MWFCMIWWKLLYKTSRYFFFFETKMNPLNRLLVIFMFVLLTTPPPQIYFHIYIIRFVISTVTQLFIKVSFVYPLRLPPPHAGVMGCGAAEATGQGLVCFVVINPCVLSTNSWFGPFLLFNKFSNYSLPQTTAQRKKIEGLRAETREFRTKATPLLKKQHQAETKLVRVETKLKVGNIIDGFVR